MEFITTGGVILAVIAVIIISTIRIYNRLVELRNRVKNAFSQIDVQLRRKHDLIPNLVESVKGYMAHEREVLQKITEARAGAQKALDEAAKDPSDAESMKKLIQSESRLAGGLRGFRLTVENYPDLKASQNMIQFQNELTSTENKVAFARQAFNDSVLFYNTGRQKFPTVMFAGMMGFKDAEPFEIPEAERDERTRVSF